MTLLLELKKIFSNKRNICIIAIVFVIKIIMCISSYSDVNIDISTTKGELNKDIYKEYMNKYAGEYTTEKHNSLTKEYEDCERELSKFREIEENYKLGILSKSEYDKSYKKNVENNKKGATLEYIIMKCDYMKNLNERADFSYDLELEKYLDNKDIDYLLIVLIIFIFTKFFTDDYYCGFNNMICATKNGRNKLFKAKLLSTVLVSFVISLVYQIMEVVIVLSLINFDRTDIGMHSLMGLAGCFSNISVFYYIVLSILYKTFFIVALGLIVMFISNLLKNNILIYGTVLAYICLPWYSYQFLKNGICDIVLAQGINARKSLCEVHTVCGLNNSLFSIITYSIACMGMIVIAYRLNSQGK